jgi:hypothetical protein
MHGFLLGVKIPRECICFFKIWFFLVDCNVLQQQIIKTPITLFLSTILAFKDLNVSLRFNLNGPKKGCISICNKGHKKDDVSHKSADGTRIFTP